MATISCLFTKMQEQPREMVSNVRVGTRQLPYQGNMVIDDGGDEKATNQPLSSWFCAAICLILLQKNTELKGAFCQIRAHRREMSRKIMCGAEQTLVYAKLRSEPAHRNGLLGLTIEAPQRLSSSQRAETCSSHSLKRYIAPR